MSYLKAHWVWVAHLLAVALVFLEPSVKAFAASHSAYAGPIAAVEGVLLAWARSPRNQ